MKIRPVGSRVVTCGQTEEHEAIIVVFCNFLQTRLKVHTYTYNCHYSFRGYSVRHQQQSASHCDPFTPGRALRTYSTVGSADPSVSQHMTPCV